MIFRTKILNYETIRIRSFFSKQGVNNEKRTNCFHRSYYIKSKKLYWTI